MTFDLTEDGRVCPHSLSEVNLFDSSTWVDPVGTYRFLRDEAPVWCDDKSGAWIITRYEDVKRVITDPDSFSVEFDAWAGTGWKPSPHLNLRDDPDHRSARRVIQRGFNNDVIRGLEPSIVELAHRLIDGFIDAGQCDFTEAFAIPLPLRVICSHMGNIPEEDLGRIKNWTDAWMRRLGNGTLLTPDEEADCDRASAEMEAYFQPLFNRLRSEPDDSWLSYLVNTEVVEWGRPMNNEELQTAMLVDTFIGGAETTANAFGLGIMLLIKNPELWKTLKTDPETAIPPFVEELLRLEGPAQSHMRRATRDVEIGGVLIPAEAMVNIRYGSANRDEREFPEPDKIDLHRQNPRAHFGFGRGVHHCLGGGLARQELCVGFTALAERIEDFAPLDPEQPWMFNQHFVLRGLRSLPLRFTPAQEGTK